MKTCLTLHGCQVAVQCNSKRFSSVFKFRTDIFNISLRIIFLRHPLTYRTAWYSQIQPHSLDFISLFKNFLISPPCSIISIAHEFWKIIHCAVIDLKMVCYLLTSVIVSIIIVNTSNVCKLLNWGRYQDFDNFFHVLSMAMSSSSCLSCIYVTTKP